MKYKIELDDDKYVLGVVHYGDDRDEYTDEEINSFFEIGKRLNCYKKYGKSFRYDQEKANAEEKEEAEKEEHEKEISVQTLKLAEMFVDMGIDADTFLNRIDAQVLYSALMTDTLLEDEDVA